MVKTEDEVQLFLNQFFPKFDVWGILYINREKNLEALRLLGITPIIRDSVIRGLETLDYVETIQSLLLSGNDDLWVFGKDYDGTELYIKIAMGIPNDKTVCISFHLAEHPISYAFK
jgi:hypothetical protein